ncbi:hypothetical protein ACJ4V0_21130 [Phreatobacter sp. HK31-P]
MSATIIGWQLVSNAANKARYAASKALYDATVKRDAAKSLALAKADYEAAYKAYYPKWQAWHDATVRYEKDRKAFLTWQEDRKKAEAIRHEMGEMAQEVLTSLHRVAQERGRLELELSKPEHLTTLFRELFKEAAFRRPELWILREPEFASPLVKQVADLLPPAPQGPKALSEQRTLPNQPQMPSPPYNLVMQSYGTTSRPVPPEQVKWS